MVDERYSWRKHVEYPATPSSPIWKSPPSPPSAPPKPRKPKPAKAPTPPKYACYYPDSPLSRKFEDWYSPECTIHVDETKLKAYWNEAGCQAYVEEDYCASIKDSESEMSRRMRVAREVDEQMRADEEMLKQKQRERRREAKKAHWEMQGAREREMWRESERKAERAHWELQVAREHTREDKNMWEEKEWERVRVAKTEENARGPGIQGLEHENWEHIPIVRPKREVKLEYGLRYQKPGDYEEWSLEIHSPVRGMDKGKGVMHRPQRWIEVSEKAKGKMEVVMIRRRKPRY